MDDPIWDVTVFTKNRQRLLAGDIADAFFAAVLKQARSRDLLSDEHFTVDGTLLEAWAGQKSFRRVDDNHQLREHRRSDFSPGDGAHRDIKPANIFVTNRGQAKATVPSVEPGLVRFSSEPMVAALMATLSGLREILASPKSRT